MSNLKTIRTDVVGSLLRPPVLKDARARFDDGAIGAEHFRAIEDEVVLAAVRLQEAVGLDVVTDGEMRRLNFQDSFGAAVEGYDAVQTKMQAYEQRVDPAVQRFRPELILVSAGFDAHASDPLAGLELSTDAYRRLAEMIAGWSDQHSGGRSVWTLEGGYDLAALGDSVVACLLVLTGF